MESFELMILKRAGAAWQILTIITDLCNLRARQTLIKRKRHVFISVLKRIVSYKSREEKITQLMIKMSLSKLLTEIMK